MCPRFAFRLGDALARYLKQASPSKPIKVILGRDTRASGTALQGALICGLNQHGIHAHGGGIVPTPAVARAVINQQADLGIVISASHNPATDNGIKIFDRHGSKLSPEQEAEIEALLEAEISPPANFANAQSYQLDVSALYTESIQSLREQHCLKKRRLVLDTANGATCHTSRRVFEYLGAELHLLGNNPETGLINDGVGSEHPENLARAVLEEKAYLGVAHDGDGDRLVVCDETGRVIPGDILLALFGVYAMQAGKLAANTLVATVHSNLGLDRALKSVGASVERVAVGDRNVARRMREIGSNIGGESSGHIIFSDWATTGDGLLAALKLTELIDQTGKPLSELAREIILFPQLAAGLKVAEKPDLDSLSNLQHAKKQIEAKLGDSGRVLMRYSGTEPKLRLLVEGTPAATVKNALQQLVAAADKDLDLIDG